MSHTDLSIIKNKEIGREKNRKTLIEGVNEIKLLNFLAMSFSSDLNITKAEHFKLYYHKDVLV